MDKPPPSPTASGTTPDIGPAAQTADLTGKKLGDFQLLHRLGQGGMGQVYLAEQVSLKRKVALKILRPDLAANPTSLERFKAEALAVARATHANIVQVYAINEAEGLHYMALEYVEGRNLREFLEKKGPPEVLVSLSIMRQVAAALQRASELGIIHRDIKPENILLTRKGEVKVADFGLSRIFAEDGQPLHLTQSGVTMGTPLYMSPEQVEGKPVDFRTDIYSFGVTSYHLLSGQPPFRGQSPFEVAVQHVQKEPTPLHEVRPDLPPEVSTVVHRMMAKKPEDRYQTCRDIVRDLSRLRDALAGVTGSISNPLLTLGPAPAQAHDTVTTQPVPLLQRPRLLWIAALSILLALGGGLLLGFFRNRAASTVPSAPDDTGPVKGLFSQKEREKELQRLVKEHVKPGADILESTTGLRFSIELGLLYLKDRRLDEAEQFFKEIDRPGVKFEPKTAPYRLLSHLGQAMVLAFRDEHRESNKHFVSLLDKADKFGKGAMNRILVLNHPQVREMMAEALHHNYLNMPSDFPKALEPYRRPPPPTFRSFGKES
jgi:tRNA A-37 threonylcarbamoyl transferase component Bud32